MWNVSKTPKTMDRHIGIELEFLMAQGRDEAQGLLDYMFERAGLTEHLSYAYELIVNEGRTVEDMYGYEVRLLCTEANYVTLVSRLIYMLTWARAYVDPRCGLHIHLDMRSRDAAECFRSLVAAQPKLYRKCDKSRKTNKYCAPCESSRLEDYTYYTGKHKGINPYALKEHSTLEVRMHEAVLDAKVIIDWITLLLETIKPCDMAKAS